MNMIRSDIQLKWKQWYPLVYPIQMKKLKNANASMDAQATQIEKTYCWSWFRNKLRADKSIAAENGMEFVQMRDVK